jgi:hypothetical protein
VAFPSYTYALANSTTADATQVMQDFNDILNGVKDGTKDHSINALTCAGTATFNGNVTLGDSSADTVTWTASLASSISIGTTNTYDVGGSTLALRSIYLASSDSAARATRIIGGTVASNWTLTLPTTAGTAFQVLKTDGAGVTSWTSEEATNNGSEGAGTTNLTISSNTNQITTLSAARTYVLPTTSVPTGYRITITNTADFALTVQASGGTTVAVVHVGTVSLIANTATPTAKADWIVDRLVSKTTVSSTWTFAGSGGTSGAVSLVLQRDKDMVRVYIPSVIATSGTAGTFFASNTAAPAAFRPGGTMGMPCNGIRNNGSGINSAGVLFALSNGTFQLFRDDGATAFTNSSSCGFQDDFLGTYYSPL